MTCNPATVDTLGFAWALWYYCIYMVFEILAIYLLVSRVWFWVATNKV